MVKVGERNSEELVVLRAWRRNAACALDLGSLLIRYWNDKICLLVNYLSLLVCFSHAAFSF